MIVTEKVTINGHELIHTYSDAGFVIERDGNQYCEAYDPANSGRTYTETDILVNQDEEATIEDYVEALAELGVSES